ncbi:hypothetical protein BDY17DRAFT_244324 [Neohortaea acidophila]|uniref:HAM1-like N-terminal domain-containing protein n=1 Tax=Neohortaea acidophila TaxID=245834 RepID=A0A6A6Q3V0_9PEZI|nr:uncharacterized protein BDY17DRAFT_244324 [Neohortaea acidophila]KAF2487128.1 hypothetical protein BDY17DRAFT_244324 [Neohortaea acidophila]
MSFLSSCFSRRRKLDDDREPLLPQYADDTELQRKLHQKLHTYQQIRAMGKGFMPSTEQVIINLRTLLSSDVLDQDNPELSESGRLLVRYTRQWIQNFTDLLRNKNDRDQIQDLIWFLSKSRISVDTSNVAARAKASKGKADVWAAYQSIKTVGSLMVMNEDFRTFLADLNVVGREVFRDSAFKLSEVANETGKQLDPSEKDKQLVAQPGQDKAIGVPSGQELGEEVQDVAKVVADGSAQVAIAAKESAEDKLSGDEGQTLLNRLKQTILSLRQRPDYSKSVSTLSLLIQRYAKVYSRVAEETIDAAAENTHQNAALDRAMHNAWLFLTSFGDEEDWKKCEELWAKVMEHKDSDPEFEQIMVDVGNSVQKMLTDPDFLDNAPAKIDELRQKSKEMGTGTSLHADVEALLRQVDLTFRGVVQDEDIHKLLQSTMKLFQILSPVKQTTNPELIQDAVHTFVPLLINAIQYLPIPRLEVSTPAIDLLLENLIIEPGTTVRHTSFLPYRLKVETYNDVDIYRTHTLRTATTSKHLVTIKLDGLSLRAEEVGFWLRLHSGIARFGDEGIASFALDERGIDIHVDVEIAQERLEQILTLKAVRVHIHKLNFTLRQSKFSWLGFLLKPLLRPILRKTLESQLATAIADFFHAANREILYARERLRATRISEPQDMLTFFKAVAARLTPPEDPDVYTRVGIAQPGKGVFKGVYAPGSIVKVWNEEGARAGERVEEFDAGGWRNEVFDTHVTVLT